MEETRSLELFWVPEIKMITDLLSIESIHLEEDMAQQVAGMHYSWIILGHSFLFSTAATIASNDYHQHYSPLILLLPILGIVLACHSFLDNKMALDVIKRIQDKVNNMLKPKYSAFTGMIQVLQKFQKGNESFVNGKEILDYEKKKIESRFKNHEMLSRFILLISVLLLLIWLLLLINESYSLWYECSLFWDTPCLSCKHSNKLCPEHYL